MSALRFPKSKKETLSESTLLNMKKADKRIIVISIIFGSVFGLIALVSTTVRLAVYAGGLNNTSLNLSDIIVFSFLHRDFDRFDYLWRRDSSILFTPLIYYFIGSIVGSQPFLSINKSYHSFIYHRAQNSRRLSNVLLGNIWIPITTFSAFYFLSICIGMFFYTPDCIERMLTIPVIDLVAFFVMRLLILSFLVQFLFITFIKTEAAIALLSNVVMIILIFLITIHIQLFNLIVFDDLEYLLQSILVWMFINAGIRLTIRFFTKYELA